MTCWIYKYCHTFSPICVPVRTESKITVKFMKIFLRLTARISANFCSIFVKFSHLWKFFLNIMTRFKKIIKKCFVTSSLRCSILLFSFVPSGYLQLKYVKKENFDLEMFVYVTSSSIGSLKILPQLGSHRIF